MSDPALHPMLLVDVHQVASHVVAPVRATWDSSADAKLLPMTVTTTDPVEAALLRPVRLWTWGLVAYARCTHRMQSRSKGSSGRRRIGATTLQVFLGIKEVAHSERRFEHGLHIDVQHRTPTGGSALSSRHEQVTWFSEVSPGNEGATCVGATFRRQRVSSCTATAGCFPPPRRAALNDQCPQ